MRLLQTLAASMSVALENARLFDETQRLLKETEQRAAELAIINSVQEGLASKLDMQAIYDLVGDKIRDIFDAQDVRHPHLRSADRHACTIPYCDREGASAVAIEPVPLGSRAYRSTSSDTRQPLLINDDMEQAAREFGSTVIAGTEMRQIRASVCR